MISLIINSPYALPSQHWQQDNDGWLSPVNRGARRATRSSMCATTPAASSRLDLVNEIRDGSMPGAPPTIRVSPPSPAPAGSLARPDGPPVPVLLLPAGGDRDADLVGRGAGGLQAGHPHSGRRRAVGAAVQQDGHRHRQDHGDGDDHHLAGAERLTYPKRNKDFSRAIFIVAPGLTVKERLQVLYPGEPDNVYDAFASARPRRCARSSTRPRCWSRTGTR